MTGTWVSGSAADLDSQTTGSTKLRLQSLLKGIHPTLDTDSEFTLSQHQPGNAGELFLVFGKQREDAIEWTEVQRITAECLRYISSAPSPTDEKRVRLAYYMGYLEHPQQAIAIDAYSEFANASYEDVAALRKLMPREKLREWLASEEENPDREMRVGLYGLMLGLCGQESDAEFLRQEICNSKESRLGLNGLIAGYLVLTGESGLDIITSQILLNPDAEFSQRFAVMEALRFLWSYEQNEISKTELISSMRLMLKEPMLTSLAVTDLARWKDWESVDQISALYGQSGYDDITTKRAIVRYLLLASAAETEEATATKDSHKVTDMIARIREREPAVVASAERYLLLD